MFNVRWVEAKVAIKWSGTGAPGWNGARLCLCAWAAVVTFIYTTALCVGKGTACGMELLGLVQRNEWATFAVRCWGGWNERRRNGVKDSVVNAVQRNERNAWTKWRCSEWTYRKHMAITDASCFIFFCTAEMGGGVCGFALGCRCGSALCGYLT